MRARSPIEGMSKPLWAGVSKTREERLRFAHCGQIKAIVREVNAGLLDGYEHEHQAGTAWFEDEVIASVTPPVDSYKIFTLPADRGGAWINISSLPRASR